MNRPPRVRFAPVLLLGIATVAGAADDLGPLPRFEPVAADRAADTVRAQDGFRLDLLAAEPLTADPVAGAYDEDGRLYVAEMADYPHVDPANDVPFAENRADPPLGRVRLLIDDNGDGRFDTSHVFADGLSWPTGVACWKGGVFVAATPDIWYLRDNDGDGRADERRKVFTGFRKFNVQAVMNNLRWGLDHRLYGAASGNGGQVRPAGEPEAAAVPVVRRDFRFDPATLRFEAISGGARFGNTFDDRGNRFLCDIRNPAEHVVLPARYLERNPHLPPPKPLHDAAEHGDAIPIRRISPPEPWRELRARRWAAVGKPLPRSELVGAGFLTSSSGLTVYRGDAYPPAYRGNLFLGEVANNVILRLVVEPDGVTFVARRPESDGEFLGSTDTWFRPVNFVDAPDGTLHVLDMYRETIEHPWSIPDDIRARLDLRSGADRGRIYRLTPPEFRQRPAPKLSRATTADLVALLAHPDGWHRDTAHRLLYERQDRDAVGPLRAMLRDGEEPLGRLHALWSLDGLNSLEIENILTSLRDSEPAVREHAARLAEPRLAGAAALRDAVLGLADDPAVRVRFQAAFTLGELDDDRVAPALATIGRRDPADPWIRAAVLSSATRRPADLFAALGDAPRDAALDPLLAALAVVIGARNRGAEVARVVQILAGSERGGEVLIGLGDGLARAKRRLADLRPGLVEDQARWLDARFARAAEMAADDSAPPDRREAAARQLGQADWDRAVATLPGLLGPTQPGSVQRAAVRSLAGFDRPEVPALLLEHWPGAAPATRADVVAALLGRRSWLGPLLEAVADGTVPAGQIPPARRALLLADRDPKVRDRARAVLGESTPGPRAEAIARYRPALEGPTDADRGRKVFDRECMTCHRLGDRGHAVGPNLAGISRRAPDELLDHILDPNREVAPDFFEYVVQTDDGRVAAGLIAAETATGLTLRRAGGEEETILRSNLADVAGTGKSLMPEGLEKTVSPREMADLIAFLLELQR